MSSKKISPQNTLFNNRSKYRDYNLYTEEYYGGSDCYIYVGKTRYSMAAVQFSVQEQQKPIYGYSSRTYDDIAVGNRIVVGTLKIPVKNKSKGNISTYENMENNSIGKDLNIDVPGWVYGYTPAGKTSKKIIKNRLNNSAPTTKGDVYTTGVEDKRKADNVPKKSTGTIVSTMAARSNISPSETRKRISEVQNKLGVTPTGIYDTKTKDAIKKYQKKNGLNVSSVITPELYNSLGLNKEDGEILEDTEIRLAPSKSAKTIAKVIKGEKVLKEKTYTSKKNSGDKDKEAWAVVQVGATKKRGYVDKSKVKFNKKDVVYA